MLNDLAFVIALVAVVVVVARGAFNVAVSGFLTVAFGSLACAALLSMGLSAVAAAVIQSLDAPSAGGGGNGGSFAVAVLSAFAQPTLTGIALLGVAVVGGYGCAVIIHAAEEMSVLLESHRVLQASAATRRVVH